MAAADYGALVSQGTAAGNAAIDADAKTNSLMLQKMGGGAGLINAGGYYAQATSDIQNEANVVKENFAARMREESIRAQLHQSYMDIMWRNLGYQQKAMKNQEIGAMLGVAGSFIGSALSSTNSLDPKSMNTEQLADAGLIDPQTGNIDQEAMKAYQQNRQSNLKLAGGISKGGGVLEGFGQKQNQAQNQMPNIFGSGGGLLGS